MAENDFIIKPVEGLQSVTGLNSIGPREERNNQKQQQRKHEKHFVDEIEQLEIEKEIKIIDNGTDENKLDFKA